MTNNSAAQLSTTINPDSIVTYLEYDDAGRQTKLVQNWTAGSGSSSSSSSPGAFESDDVNVEVRTAYTYGYDRASNRLYRENTLAAGKDERYTYDGANRLATFARGELNANKDAISGTPRTAEEWSLTGGKGTGVACSVCLVFP